MRLSNKIFLGLVLIAFSFAGFAIAQGLTDIEYPIPELANCENEEECKDYCNEPAHILECIAFGEEHNLISSEEAELGKRFASDIAAGTTPGSCTNKEECDKYCTDITNIHECLAFAEKHDIENVDIEEVRKIADYLAGGGTMPGDCRSEEECKLYCDNIAHFEECVLFAQEAGLPDAPDDLTIEQIRKIRDLQENGETPGGCQGQEDCEAYCSEPENGEECVAFALEVGLITPEDAERFEKFGGYGPGGCQGEEECSQYCNDPSNGEECFAFAAEHGFIDEEAFGEHAQDFGAIRDLLHSLDETSIQCLEEGLGAQTVEDLLEGRQAITEEVGEYLHRCSFTSQTERLNAALQSLTPEQALCLEETFGFEQIERIKNGEGTDADINKLEHALSACIERSFREKIEIESFQRDFESSFREEDFELFEDGLEQDSTQATVDVESTEPAVDLDAIFNNLPVDVRSCVAEKLGSDYEERVFSGEIPAHEISATAEACVREQLEAEIRADLQSRMASFNVASVLKIVSFLLLAL